MPNALTVLVTGATGHQGGGVVRQLLGRGHRVRALTRRPESPAARQLQRLGAQVLRADYDLPQTLRAAMTGVDGVFALTTPLERGALIETEQGRALADAALAVRVPHFVYASVAGARAESSVPHFESKRRVELHLREIGLPHTVVAPVFLMDSLLEGRLLLSLQRGALALALPPTRLLQLVSVAELGAFAALCLERRAAHLGRRIELSSDEQTGPGIAATLTEITGRPLRYLELPLGQVRARDSEQGTMFDWLDRVGDAVDIGALRRDYPEINWGTLAAWGRQQDWSALLEPARDGGSAWSGVP